MSVPGVILVGVLFFTFWKGSGNVQFGFVCLVLSRFSLLDGLVRSKCFPKGLL
jgi:hypothetical protein